MDCIDLGFSQPFARHSFQIGAWSATANCRLLVGLDFSLNFPDLYFHLLGPSNNQHFGSKGCFQGENYPAVMVLCAPQPRYPGCQPERRRRRFNGGD